VVDQVFGPYGLGSGTDRELGPAAGPAFFLDGLSKLLCAPGLKLGWVRLEAAAGVKAGIAPLLDEIADTFLPASTVMSLALLGLLGLAEGVIATTRRRLSANLAHLQAALPEGARVRHAGGGWMALVDLPWEGEGDLALHLLQRGRVAVHPGWFYDLPDPDCVALSLLPEPGRFADGVARLVSAL
jgi:aspartate/methionine/tyrosine aminotransferase